VDLCPIVHGTLFFAHEPFSFTSGLFLSAHFGFACGPFSTSQMNRFLSQRDLCLSLADLFVRAGLLSTICRPISLINGPYSFTRTQWTFQCHKLFACRLPSPRADLFYCTRFAREAFYVTRSELFTLFKNIFTFERADLSPITCGYIQDTCRPI